MVYWVVMLGLPGIMNLQSSIEQGDGLTWHLANPVFVYYTVTGKKPTGQLIRFLKTLAF